MILEYNGFALQNLGDISITQAREFEDGSIGAPQRAKVTLRVTIDLFERSYDDNAALVRQAKEALATGQAVLRWHNEAVGMDYINQTAALESDDLPEEWGEYHQRFNMVFSYYDHGMAAQNVPLTLVKLGQKTGLTLENVTRWQEQASVDRFNAKRGQRREVHGKVTVSGKMLVAPTLSLAERRAQLAQLLADYRMALNQAEATLTFGAVFSRVVRVESFDGELDQAACHIAFTFTAGYTLFPDEANYATVECQVETKDDMSGMTILTLSGKIEASTEVVGRSKLEAIRAAVVKQYGYDTSSQLTQYDVTPNLISANTDGDTFTELSFTISVRKWRATNQGATFQKTGGSTPISFGKVRLWSDQYSANRFNAMRSQRQHATGMVEAAGTWVPDNPALPLAQRRTQLLAMQRAMKAECNAADGALSYGDWSQVVRIENFKAEINQAETGIDWSFSASYSLFPNESGYAVAELNVSLRDAVEEGDRYLTLSGRIGAPNGTMARTKLASLRTTLLGIYGFSEAQRLRTESATAGVDANGDQTEGIAEGLENASEDGITFIELTFNEEYRARMTGNLVSSTWQVNTSDDISTNLVQTVYSGSVTAAGNTTDDAYAAALSRAQAIGLNKEASIDTTAFLRRSQITADFRKTRSDNADECVRVTFSYEYQSKMPSGFGYMEVTTQQAQETFGVDAESVNGFVVARTLTDARAAYETQVRAVYADRLIRSEATSTAVVKTQSGSNWKTQELKLDFSFQAHVAKAQGNTALRYSISVGKDFRSMERVTQIRGSAYGPSVATCKTVLETLFGDVDGPGSGTGQYGQLLKSDLTEDHDYVNSGALDVFMKLDFGLEYADRITGDAAIVESRLTEEVRYSAVRWAVQKVPFESWDHPSQTGTGGISIPQPAGIDEGSRTVRGSVTSASLVTAMNWANRHKAMLTGDADGGHYPLPPQIDKEFEFPQRVDGVAANGLAGVGSVANVKLYRVNFAFGEILPKYPEP